MKNYRKGQVESDIKGNSIKRKEDNQDRGKNLLKLYMLPSPLEKFSFQAVLDPLFPTCRWLFKMDCLAFRGVFFSQSLHLAAHTEDTNACSPGKTIQLQKSSL